MKKLFTILAFLFFAAGFSQEIDVDEPTLKQTHIQIGHDLIGVYLQEFYDAAKYYPFHYQEGWKQLKAIKLVKANRHFLGSVENGVILLNDDLLDYPNLFRVIMFRQLGKHWGLQEDKKHGRAIMGTMWTMDATSEHFAEMLKHRGHQKRLFFEALVKQNPKEIQR